MSVMYVSEKELAVELGLTADQLRRLLTAHGKSTAMKTDPLTGKWFWPAVRQFLMHHHGGSALAQTAYAQDGEENWNM